MSSTSSQSTMDHNCDKGFEFIIPTVDQPATPGFIIEARPLDPSCKPKPKRRTDLQFNLATVLGNNNGEFAWGRAGFQKTGRNFTLHKESEAYILEGQLLTLNRVYKPAKINLSERFHVEAYFEERSGIKKLRHKLRETEPLLDSRTLILCFDGTSNQFNDKNTNVVKLVELLMKDDPKRQMVYYQTGVGTYAPPGFTTSVGLNMASLIDQGVAWYLHQHVIDGYKFLMQTYRAGDRIALFGFSRGAFTARALAGMLHSVGLLPAHNAEHVPFAYEVYKKAQDSSDTRNDDDAQDEDEDEDEDEDDAQGDDDSQDHDKSTEPPEKTSMFAFSLSEPATNVKPKDFKKAFCTPVLIDFVGVWDTVASVGALFPQKLPYIDHNPSIITFRQALALDERRGCFIPSLWNHSLTKPTQDVREVWFRGEHTDVGGGSQGPDSKKDGMLSNISLRWMVRQIIHSKAGLLFDHVASRSYWKKGIIEKMHRRRDGKPARDREWVECLKESIKLDKRDIKNRPFDSIADRPLLWNLIEHLGINCKVTIDAEFKTDWTRWPNAKAPRSIYCKKRSYPIFIHRSVVDFMAKQQKDEVESDKAYLPRAIWHCKEKKWPRIEDVLPLPDGKDLQAGASVKPKSEMRINRVTLTLTNSPDKENGWWLFFPFRNSFVGYALAAAIWLSLVGVPKSELAAASSYFESLFGFRF